MPRAQSGFLVIVHVQENVSACLRILLATLLTRGCHRVCTVVLEQKLPGPLAALFLNDIQEHGLDPGGQLFSSVAVPPLFLFLGLLTSIASPLLTEY